MLRFVKHTYEKITISKFQVIMINSCGVSSATILMMVVPEQFLYSCFFVLT